MSAANDLLVTECIKVSKKGYQEPYHLKLAALALAEQVLDLQKWVNDLHAGMFINCVYCGHRYGPQSMVPTGDAVAKSVMADVLKQHIAQCPKHPMSELLRVVESGVELLTDRSPNLVFGLARDSWLAKAELAIARAKGGVA